jgi:UDP-2,3-diacylglucosamine hydrolase
LSLPASHQAQPQTVALFVSDLHLTAQMPKTAQAFFRFLHDHARHAQQLYLLGDIFEYWAGDDDLDDAFNQSVVEAIAAVSRQGVAVYWIAGNRDFLVGDDFARACGMTLLDEPHVTTIAGQRLLLVHGDAQCTDDTAYIAFRNQVRDPTWQHNFLTQPLAQRKALIAGMREGSRDAQRAKTMAIMDVNFSQIEQLFVTHAVKLLIHGHTHRPAQHETAAGTRYVLPDWDCDAQVMRGGWIEVDAEGVVTQIRLG